MLVPAGVVVGCVCGSASNPDPARFRSICLIRQLESSLGGVLIGADRDPNLKAINPRSQRLKPVYGWVPPGRRNTVPRLLLNSDLASIRCETAPKTRPRAELSGFFRPTGSS